MYIGADLTTEYVILAQAGPEAPAPAPGKQPPAEFSFFSGPVFPMLVILLVFWFIMLNGKRKQERKRQDMLNNMKKNDRIVTIGGLLGTIVEVRDGEVVVKADETTNTKLRFQRSAIHRVILEEEKK